MTFLYPYILFALVAPPLLALAALLLYRRAGHGWRQLISTAHPELVQRRPRWQVVLPLLLALLALTGIILAAARPINGYEQSEGEATGRNLIIALDISRSMETQDVSPSRLDEARAAAYELIDALPGDKIGLIVFSGEADVVVPLTYDHTALRDALEQVNRNWAGIGGTNFGLLLRVAMQNFARSAPNGANALVILSDGEDTVDSSLQIAEEARQNNLLVITVGIGTPTGGPIPDPKGENGLWQDASGRHIISKLDINALRRFSEATGGNFFAMSSGADLSSFAREAAEKLERHEETFTTGRVPNDLFAWFAIPSLLALLAAILLGTEWRAARHASILLLALFCTLPAQALPAPQAYEQGLLALKEGKAEEARERISEALLANDKALQAAAHLALGNIQTRATFDKLRSLYEGNEGMAQPSADDLQNIVDELNKNITPFQDALTANPELSAAAGNKELVQEFIKKLEEEIERLKQQQENQNQQDKNDQQQDDQNQQDKNDQQQGDQNQQDKNDQQQGDQNQQDKNDQQQGDQDQQDKNDQQQGDQNQQDKNDQQQGDQDQQDKNDQQQGDQNQQDIQAQQGGGDRLQQGAAEFQELSDEEKAKQRAAGILRMHLDEEQGSPIPHDTRAVRPPAKDY